LVEQALRSLVGVHVALFEHGIDLLLAVAHDLLEVLHHFLGAGRNLDPTGGGTHDTHPRWPHLHSTAVGNWGGFRVGRGGGDGATEEEAGVAMAMVEAREWEDGQLLCLRN
jgi:hypothetical protein